MATDDRVSELKMNDTNCYHAFSKVSSVSLQIYFYLFLVCCIFASFSNSVALVVFVNLNRSSKLSLKKSNKMLTSLAFSDLLVGMILYPFLCFQMSNRDNLKECEYNLTRDFIVYVLLIISGMHLVVIAYDRFITLTKPWVHEKYFPNKVVNLIIVLLWILPFILLTVDTIGKIQNLKLLYIVVRMILSLMILISLIIIIVFYILLTHRLHQREKTIISGSSSARGRSKRQVKLAKKISLLLLCSIICFFPAFIRILIGVIIRDAVFTKIYHEYGLFVLFMASLTSCLNPIIYTLKYDEFRTCLKKIVGHSNCIREERSFDSKDSTSYVWLPASQLFLSLHDKFNRNFIWDAIKDNLLVLEIYIVVRNLYGHCQLCIWNFYILHAKLLTLSLPEHLSLIDVIWPRNFWALLIGVDWTCSKWLS